MSQKGVETASSMCPNSHSKGLVYVRYRDHIELRNVYPKFYFDPHEREAVGWLSYETNDIIYLTFDRSVKSLPFEAPESGLVILKSDVVERKEIK